MVRRLAFAVPGDLATPTGGYAYDRRMIAELEQLGWHIDVVDLGDGFPWPSSETRRPRWRGSWPSRRAARSSSTGWPSAFCPTRPCSFAHVIR